MSNTILSSIFGPLTNLSIVMSTVKQPASRAETIYLKYLAISGFILWWFIIGAASLTDIPERASIAFFVAAIGYPVIMLIGIAVSGYWRELRGAFATDAEKNKKLSIWQLIGSAFGAYVGFTVLTAVVDEISLLEAAKKSIWFALMMLGIFYFFSSPSKKRDNSSNL